MRFSLLFLFLTLNTSLLYAEAFPFNYSPASSTLIEIKLLKNKVVASHPDGLTQELWDEPALKDNHIISDFNFDGYKDLAIRVAVDKIGRNSEYQIFYWNNNKMILEKGQILVNPGIQSGFIIESIHVYTSYEVRYRWDGFSLQKHSKLTPVGEDKAQTEIVFYEDNKQVRRVIVPTHEIEETIIEWDKR